MPRDIDTRRAIPTPKRNAAAGVKGSSSAPTPVKSAPAPKAKSKALPKLFTGLASPGKALEHKALQASKKPVKQAGIKTPPHEIENHFYQRLSQYARQGKAAGKDDVGSVRYAISHVRSEAKHQEEQAEMARIARLGYEEAHGNEGTGIGGALDKGLHGLGEGISAGEHLLAEGLATIPTKKGWSTVPKAQRVKEADLAVKVGELALPFGAAKGLTMGARGLEVGAATKALRGATGTGATGALGIRREVQLARALGKDTLPVSPTVGSTLLKGAAGASVGYGKLMGAATAARAAGATLPSGEKKHQSFGSHLWESLTETLANLPAATVEAPIHPQKTLEGVAHVYGHPVESMNENPVGALLAFLAPAAALERGAGAAVRGVSGHRFLAQDRAALEYGPGLHASRKYEPGLVSGLAQRAVDLTRGQTMNGRNIIGRTPRNEKQIKTMMEGVSHGGTKLHNVTVKKTRGEYTISADLHRDGKVVGHIEREYDPATNTWSKAHTFVEFAHQKKGIGTGISRAEERALAEHGIENLKTTTTSDEGAALNRALGGWTKGDEHPLGQDLSKVLAAQKGTVAQATKGQINRRGIGYKQAGIRPSEIDVMHGGKRLIHNVNVMERHHFLAKHIGQGGLHDDAVMTFLEGVAKRPDTFWTDVSDRIAHLKYAAKDDKMSRLDKAYNRHQIERLEALERHKDSIDPKDLHIAADSAGEIAKYQRKDWERLVAHGSGHPEQLHARNITALLTHGHLFGRGDLKFDESPGLHPVMVQLKDAKVETRAARRQVQKIRDELKGAAPRALTGAAYGPHFRLEDALKRRDIAVEREGAIREAANNLKMSGHVKPNGEQHPGVYDPLGNRITHEEAARLFETHFGGREMGFLTHKQERLMAAGRNYYGPRSTYPMRTGGNYVKGAYDNSAAALREHFDRVSHNLAEFGGQHEIAAKLMTGKTTRDGKVVWFKTEDEARHAAELKNLDESGNPVVTHLGPYVVRPVGSKKVADLIEGNPLGRDLEHAAAVEGKAFHEEHGAYGILPKRVNDRLRQWEDTEAGLQHSSLKMLTTPWRQTALYTSTRWPVGTTQENMIRLAFHNTNPLAAIAPKSAPFTFKTGSNIERFLDEKISDPDVSLAEKRAATFHRAMYGAGNFVGSQLHDLEPALRELAQKQPWLDNHPVLKGLHESKLPRHEIPMVPHALGWAPWRRFVGNNLAKMETNAKLASVGKLARRDQAFFTRFKKNFAEQAAHDYVEKLTTNPEASIAEARKLMDIMGNWNHLTPMTRQAQAIWAPFALWWLNSAKFVFKTLPKDHPYALGLLSAIITANGEQHKDLKGYLMGDVPVDLPILGKMNLNPVHYSPFDIAHEPGKVAGGMILPQAAPAGRLMGFDAFRKQSYDSEGVAAEKALEGIVEGYLPLARVGSEIAREGGSQDIQSPNPIATKPGTRQGLAWSTAKALAPLKFDKPSIEQREAAEKKRKHKGKRARLPAGGIAPTGPVVGGGSVYHPGPVPK